MTTMCKTKTVCWRCQTPLNLRTAQRLTGQLRLLPCGARRQRPRLMTSARTHWCRKSETWRLRSSGRKCCSSRRYTEANRVVASVLLNTHSPSISLSQRPSQLMALWPRQRKARMNCTQTSPLVQHHLRWATPSGLKRQEGLGRTIPVPWAVAGSSETHRKK